jgi:tetratricopeptide (TPR) repeat protein
MGKAQRIKRRRTRETSAVEPPRARLGIVFWILCLLLVAATATVYWQVTGFPLINCDDRDYITNNPIVKAGLTSEGLAWAFNVGYAGNWHPLTWLSHMLDSQLFGPGAPEGPGPAGRHMVSLLLHVLNTVLLFLVAARMTGFVWRAAFVAAVFALHPQHVESVAWVAERKDVLSTLFLLLALLGYDWYVRRPGLFRYTLVALAFALGLMAKPMLVTLPVLLLVLDYWPLRRFANGWDWKLVLEKIPFLAISIVSSVLTVRAQHAAGAVRSLEDLTLAERVSNAVMSYAIYITKTFWPSNLGNYYTYPKGGWPTLEVAGAVLLLAAITVLSIVTVRRRPYLLTGWLWYVISLVPVIGFVQVGSQARADRYTYVPLIGISIMIAFLLPDLLSRKRPLDDPQPSPWTARTLGVLAVAAVAAMSWVTYVQIGYWKDGIAVARRAIAVTENNWFEEQSLGSQLQDEAERLANIGKEAQGLRKAEEAALWLRRSIAHEDTCADAHNDLGRALALMKDYEGAVREYQRAIELYPHHRLAPNNLGNTYLSLRRIDEAIDQYERTLELDPTNIFATYNMGIAFQTSGDFDAAIQQYLRVLQLQPNDYFAHWARYNAGLLLGKTGNTAEGTRMLQEAVRINEATRVDPHNEAAKLLGQ